MAKMRGWIPLHGAFARLTEMGYQQPGVELLYLLLEYRVPARIGGRQIPGSFWRIFSEEMSRRAASLLGKSKIDVTVGDLYEADGIDWKRSAIVAETAKGRRVELFIHALTEEFPGF